MSKISLTNLVNLQNETTAVNAINTNNAAVTTAINNTVSRDGTQPNTMGANLDMNSNRIINLVNAVSTTEPVTLSQMTAALAAAGDINTGLTGVPVSAAMQPVVNASTTSAAELLLGVTPAMQPVVNSTTTANAATLLGLLPAVTPEQFGAVGDGSHDDTIAVQAAITAAGTGGMVYFDNKTYKITSGLVDNLGVFLQGSGETSILSFSPSADGTLLTVSAGTSSISQGGISNLLFFSPDVTFNKIAILLQDVRFGYNIEDVKIYGNSVGGILMWSGGAKSTGMQIKGREFIRARNLYAAADQPLQISVNPNFPTICFDMCNFHNTALVGNGNPCLLIDTGVVISRSSFTGSLWCGLGTAGIKWADTTSTVSSQGLLIENFGTEQGTSSSDYSVDISTNNNLYNFRIMTAELDPTRKGIKLRKCVNPLIENIVNGGASEMINADGTVTGLTIRNIFSTAPHVISGLTSLWSTPKLAGSLVNQSEVFSSSASGINQVFQSFLVANLPTPATNQGRIAYVLDSTATITAGIGATVVGGGANVVPVFCDGTNWKIF